MKPYRGTTKKKKTFQYVYVGKLPANLKLVQIKLTSTHVMEQADVPMIHIWTFGSNIRLASNRTFIQNMVPWPALLLPYLPFKKLRWPSVISMQAILAGSAAACMWT